MSPKERWTVLDVITWSTGYFKKKGSSTPRLDAELLLGHTLDCDRVRLYMNPDQSLLTEELQRFKEIARQRAAGVSVAHLTGTREFWNADFKVPRGVFVPRPETEFMVEFLLDRLSHEACRGADLCCGSGAIGLTLALERPQDYVTLVDGSELACKTTLDNARTHDIESRISLQCQDVVEFLEAQSTTLALDYVVSNPPYIPDGEWEELPPEVRLHEPREALLSGPDGLDLLRRLIPAILGHLKPSGWVLVEYSGPEQTSALVDLFGQSGYCDIEVHPDLAEIDRIISAKRA